MTPEQEPRIRELIRLFVGETDPEKRRILAAELERLLTPISPPTGKSRHPK